MQRFYNARAVLFQVARALSHGARSTILLPAFHCPSVVEPIIRAGMRPSFYRIDRNLQVDCADVLGRLNDDVAAVVFVNYFGFPAVFEPLLPALRARDILAVEDCAHACVSVDPLELSGRRADASVYAFWKLLPSGVGGGLWLSPETSLALAAPSPAPLANSLVLAKRLAEEAIMGEGESSPIARLYGFAERLRVRIKTRRASAPPDTAADSPRQVDEASEYFFDPRLAESRIPRVAEWILARADLASAAAARRANYATLARLLSASGLVASPFPVLPSRIVPLAYPVFLDDRSVHDIALRRRGVPVWTFGSTLHRALFERGDPAIVSDASHLSETLLMIPVHQLLSQRNMSDFAGTIVRYHLEHPECASI